MCIILRNEGMGLYIHTNIQNACFHLNWCNLQIITFMFYCQFHSEDLSYITLVYHLGVVAIIALTWPIAHKISLMACLWCHTWEPIYQWKFTHFYILNLSWITMSTTSL